MFNNKWIQTITPKGILWKLTLVNSIIITSAMGLTGWAIYETACSLVGGIGHSSPSGQLQFNATLFQYFLIFTSLGVLISVVIHYYLTKKLIKPIRALVNSTKTLKEGTYPPPIKLQSSGEMKELIQQYNDLIHRLEGNDEERKKLIENISHELRTPTANIKGYLYALKEGDLQGDAKLFESLYSQAEQLTALIEQVERLHLLDRDIEQTTYDKEIYESHELIEESIQLFDWQLKQSSLVIEKDIEPALLWIHKSDMQQVLSNLLENAIRYRINNDPIYIEGFNEQAGYTIAITGEGEEIPSKDHQRIFERFYRVEDSRNRTTGGSGLGLSIAKEIVLKHGGTIQLRTEGQKHTFTIWIPHE